MYKIQNQLNMIIHFLLFKFPWKSTDLRNEGVWEFQRLDDVVTVPILLRRNEGVGVPRVTRPTNKMIG